MDRMETQAGEQNALSVTTAEGFRHHHGRGCRVVMARSAITRTR